MKRISIIICIFISAVTLFAQNNNFSYQAVVRDSNNHLVIEQLVGVRISLLRDIPNGVCDYAETHTVKTTANGLIALMVGKGNVVSGSMTNLDWTKHSYYLKSEFDITGGSNYTITGTQLVSGVPFAQHADNINFTEQQTLTISNDTIFLNGATNSFVKLPVVDIHFPDSLSSYINDVGYLTYDSIQSVSYFNNDAGYITSYVDSQQITLSGDTLKLERGGSVVLPVSCCSLAVAATTKADSLLGVVDSLDGVLTALGTIACQPKVITTVVTGISTYTAVCGGNVVSPCGYEITERGICWNTTGNADLNDSHSAEVGGVGNFTGTLTNLLPQTKYFVRAYAICGNDIVYGADMVFVTK